MIRGTQTENKEVKSQEMQTGGQIYQLKIKLKYGRPVVWRRLKVPDNTRLDRLHRIFQIVMGWENYHLHSFKAGFMSYGPKEDYLDDFEHKDEEKFRLMDIAPKIGFKFTYQYDFGYDWMHSVKVEDILSPTDGSSVPVCVAGKRACPPEDVGAVGGYDNFLEAIADPAHPDHEELRKWIGYDFKPEAFDRKSINKALRSLDNEGEDEEEEEMDEDEGEDEVEDEDEDDEDEEDEDVEKKAVYKYLFENFGVDLSGVKDDDDDDYEDGEEEEDDDEDEEEEDDDDGEDEDGDDENNEEAKNEDEDMDQDKKS